MATVGHLWIHLTAPVLRDSGAWSTKAVTKGGPFLTPPPRPDTGPSESHGAGACGHTHTTQKKLKKCAMHPTESHPQLNYLLLSLNSENIGLFICSHLDLPELARQELPDVQSSYFLQEFPTVSKTVSNIPIGLSCLMLFCLNLSFLKFNYPRTIQSSTTN